MRHLSIVLFAAGVVAATLFATALADRGPFERTPAGIEGAMWALATAPAGEEEAPSPYYAPLMTPLSAVYARGLGAIAGEGVGAARGARRVQTAVALPAFALVVYLLARKRAAPWAAAVAGGGAAFTAPPLLAAGAFDPGIFAAILALLAFLCVDGRRAPLAWGLAGASAGLAARLVPAVGWAALALLGAIALARPGATRRHVAALLLAGAWFFAAAATSLLDPTGDAIPPVNGIEFWQGHRETASGLAPRRADADSTRWWEISEVFLHASREEGRMLDAGGVEGWFVRDGLRRTVLRPDRTLARGAVKTLATLQGEPIPLETGPRFLAARSERPGLGVALWVGRILLPLGLAGLLLQRGRAGAPLLAAALTGIVAAWVGTAQPAYQLVTAGALASGLALFLAGPAPRRRIVTLPAGAACVLALFAAPATGLVPGFGTGSADHETLGDLYAAEERGSAAMREYDLAIRLDPDNPRPRVAVARMLARDNVLTEAIEELEAVRVAHPDLLSPRITLARLLEQRERWLDAARVHQELSRLHPWSAEFMNNAGTDLLKAGYYQQAEAALRRAIEIDPGYTVARANLDALVQGGIALPDSIGVSEPATAAEYTALVVAAVRGGEFARAETLLAEARARFPAPDAGLVFVEATMRLQEGRADDAIRLMESIRPAMAESEVFLNNLAAAYATANRLPEAIAIWEELLKRNPSNELLRANIERARASTGEH